MKHSNQANLIKWVKVSKKKLIKNEPLKEKK